MTNVNNYVHYLESELKRLRLIVDAADDLRALVTEGVVPRYTVTPGAALNMVVQRYDRVRVIKAKGQ